MSRAGRALHRLSGRTGALVGELLFAISPNRRRITRRSLSLAFPERTPNDLEPIARRSFRHFGASVFESVSLARTSPREICRLLSFEDWHFFDEAEADGKGLIVLTAHLGVHELVGSVVALYRGPMHVVARPFSSPFIEKRIRRIRERFGNFSIPKSRAPRGMLEALKRGERVAILIDQRVHPRQGVEVPFFGRPSWTSPLPAQISLRRGAPVLPIFAYRRPGGRYRIVAYPPIRPERSSAKPHPDEVAELTARYARATESAIRREVDQWLWMHDRWRRH